MEESDNRGSSRACRFRLVLWWSADTTKHGGGRASLDSELAENVLQMFLYGPRAHSENTPDLGIRLSRSDPLEYLSLSARQLECCWRARTVVVGSYDRPPPGFTQLEFHSVRFLQYAFQRSDVWASTPYVNLRIYRLYSSVLTAWSRSANNAPGSSLRAGGK